MTIAPVNTTNNADSTLEMNPNQKEFISRCNRTVQNIVQELLQLITQSKSMKTTEFKANYIDNQKQLSSLDQRTQNFVIKILNVVQTEVNNVPTLSMSLKLFGLLFDDAQIGNQLLVNIALPRLQSLKSELDDIKPSIVDDVIASEL